MKNYLRYSLLILPLILTSCGVNSSSSSSEIVEPTSKITVNYNDGSEPQVIEVKDKEEYDIAFPTNGVYDNKYFLGYYTDEGQFPATGTWDINKGDITINALWGDSKLLKRTIKSTLSEQDYEYTFIYKPSSLLKYEIDKDLTFISFASSMMSADETSIKDFYNELAFQHVETYNYDVVDPDNVAFALAHKKVGNRTVVSVAIRSGNYGVEWANNFTVGSMGNHKGFYTSATKVAEQIEKYVKDKSINKNTARIWINGYSRGGGVANVLAHKLTKEGNYLEEQILAYTFEAPRGVYKGNYLDQFFVYNFFNSADIVSAIAPIEYELKREGIDLNIYKDNVDELYKEIYGVDLPTFISSSHYSNDNELLDFVCQTLLQDLGDKKDMHDRDSYVANFEAPITYLFKLYYSLPSKVIRKIKLDLQEMTGMELMSYLREDGPYDFLSPIFDSYKISYDKDELKNETNKIIDFVINGGGELVAAIATSEISLERFIDMHMPEVTYSLLRNYNFESKEGE